MKAELTIGKSVITFVIVLFSIIVYCRFQCEGQGKKQTFECQKYHLLQAHLDRWDADNHRIENSGVTELHLHSNTSIISILMVIGQE
jgi:hypothetical protein